MKKAIINIILFLLFSAGILLIFGEENDTEGWFLSFLLHKSAGVACLIIMAWLRHIRTNILS